MSEVFAGWRDARVRVPEPVRAVDGSWSDAGWAAHRWVEGGDLNLCQEMHLIRRASGAFHRVVRPLPRPAFLDERWDPWSYGDRVAWEGVVAPVMLSGSCPGCA